jgi:hypothetical protein
MREPLYLLPRTPSDAHPVTTIDGHRSVSDPCQAMMAIAA